VPMVQGLVKAPNGQFVVATDGNQLGVLRIP
jgi:hypothetical protein